MLKDEYHLALKMNGQLEVGDALPVIDFEISRTQVFMYSAVTWNRHKIHYDLKAAKEEGHDDILVQRGLIGNIFTRYVNEIFVDNFITNVSWKVVASVFPEKTLKCKGKIQKIDNKNGHEEVEVAINLYSEQLLVCTAAIKTREVQSTDTARPLHWRNTVTES